MKSVSSAKTWFIVEPIFCHYLKSYNFEDKLQIREQQCVRLNSKKMLIDQRQMIAGHSWWMWLTVLPKVLFPAALPENQVSFYPNKKHFLLNICCENTFWVSRMVNVPQGNIQKLVNTHKPISCLGKLRILTEPPLYARGFIRGKQRGNGY